MLNILLNLYVNRLSFSTTTPLAFYHFVNTTSAPYSCSSRYKNRECLAL